MNLDQLKQTWNSQQFKAPASPTLGRRSSNRVNAFREQLSARFRTMTVVSAVMALVMWPVGDEIGMPLWLKIWLSAYFVVMSVSHCTLWVRLRELDFGELTLKSAVETVIKLRRAMTVRIAFGITMATPLLTMMMLEFFHDDTSMFAGGVCGALLGGLAGWNLYRRNRWFIRKMQQTLADASDSGDSDAGNVSAQ